jgi:RHS repeat-associated protein
VPHAHRIRLETLWTYDAAGRKTNEVVVGVMTNRFVYNGAGDLTDLYDGRLARSQGFNSGTGAWSTHSAYHADGNGNVTALFSTSTGSQVAWYRYDAFGRMLQSSGTLSGANRMRFSSKPWMAPGVDDSAGMYYYGYRFYDPLTQRWLTRDPLGEEGGLNLYQFALNNPLNGIDAFGEFTFGIGTQCSIGAILGVELSGGIFFGYDPGTGTWSFGLLLSPGAGLQSPTLGAAGFVQATAAPTVGDLKGSGAHIGAAFTPGFNIGGEFLLEPTPKGANPLGAQLEFGIGASVPIPAETHFMHTYTVGAAWSW